MSIPKIKWNSYTIWTLLVFMIWARYPILGYVKNVFIKLPLLGDLADYVLPALFIIALFGSAGYWSKHFRSKDLAVFMLMETIAALSMVLHPENTHYTEKVSLTFMTSIIPLYLVGTRLEFCKYEKIFSVISIASVWLLVLYLYQHMERSELGEGMPEDMSMSYQTLPHVCMVVYCTLKQPKWYTILTSVVGVFLIIAFGTRGSLLCFIVFTLLYLFLIRLRTSLLFDVVIAGAAFLIIKLFDILFYTVNSLILSVGMSNRILMFFDEDDLSNSTGRDSISAMLYRAMDNAPIFGYGFGGDRQLVNTYSHNLYLELIVTFGWIIGTILFVLLLFRIIVSYAKAQLTEEKVFILLLASCSIVKLMLSNTFLNEPNLFLLLGFCSQVLYNSKRTRV